ncbi:hypothetical protein ACJJTC_003646 [Scirpophaga incertulas]
MADQRERAKHRYNKDHINLLRTTSTRRWYRSGLYCFSSPGRVHSGGSRRSLWLWWIWLLRLRLAGRDGRGRLRFLGWPGGRSPLPATTPFRSWTDTRPPATHGDAAASNPHWASNQQD